MSSELKVNELLENSNDIPLKSNYVEQKISAKVNINTLMQRLRKTEKKEKNENLVLLCFVCTVAIATGVVAYI